MVLPSTAPPYSSHLSSYRMGCPPLTTNYLPSTPSTEIFCLAWPYISCCEIMITVTVSCPKGRVSALLHALQPWHSFFSVFCNAPWCWCCGWQRCSIEDWALESLISTLWWLTTSLHYLLQKGRCSTWRWEQPRSMSINITRSFRKQQFLL